MFASIRFAIIPSWLNIFRSDLSIDLLSKKSFIKKTKFLIHFKNFHSQSTGKSITLSNIMKIWLRDLFCLYDPTDLWARCNLAEAK